MKQIIFILLLFPFLICPSMAWGQPSLVFSADSHDFGYVAEGVQLEYAFEFINTGSEELVIKEVNTS